MPDEGGTIYLFNPSYNVQTFDFDARMLIDEADYRDIWPNIESRSKSMDLLQHKAAVHLADYTREIDTKTYTEDSLHVFPLRSDLSELAESYLGDLVARLVRREPMPEGPRCNRCIATTEVIGIANIEPGHGHSIVQHTIMHQCPTCGRYRQTGFEDGSDWISDRLTYRQWCRLLPDPYVRNGRFRMTYEATGLRLNLDGQSFHAGDPCELLYKGTYRRGRVHHGLGRFEFEFHDNDEMVDLLPGMQARLLQN